MNRDERANLNQLIIPVLFDNSQEACDLRIKQGLVFKYRGNISEDKNRFTLREEMDLSAGDVFHSNLSGYYWCVIDADKTDTEEGWIELYSDDYILVILEKDIE